MFHSLVDESQVPLTGSAPRVESDEGFGWKKVAWSALHIVLVFTILLLPWLLGFLIPALDSPSISPFGRTLSSWSWIFAWSSLLYFLTYYLTNLILSFVSVLTWLFVQEGYEASIFIGFAKKVVLVPSSRRYIHWIVFLTVILGFVGNARIRQCQADPLTLVDDLDKNHEDFCRMLASLWSVIVFLILVLIVIVIIRWVTFLLCRQYQSDVFKDRTLFNNYQLYVTNLLFESALNQGSLQGRIYVEAPSDHTTSPGDYWKAKIDFQSVDSIASINPYDADEASLTPMHKIPKLFLRAFKSVVPSKNAPSLPPAFSSSSLGQGLIYPLLDFNSFKKAKYTIPETARVSVAEAKSRADFIFSIFSSPSLQPGQSSAPHLGVQADQQPEHDMYGEAVLRESDFGRAFPTQGESISEAFRIYDLNNDGQLSLPELRKAFLRIYKEAHDIRSSWDSSAQALDAVEGFMVVVALLILSFVMLVVWGINPQSLLTLSLSVILALNAVIGNLTRDIFDTLVFLFMAHPFDIGDRVQLGSKGHLLTVHRIDLLRTLFLDEKGRLISIHNTSLIKENITNYRRSLIEQYETFDLLLDIQDLSMTHLNNLRNSLTSFLKKSGSNYFYSKFDMETLSNTMLDIGEDDKLCLYKIRVRVKAKPTLDTMRISDRNYILKVFLEETLRRLNIPFYSKGSISGEPVKRRTSKSPRSRSSSSSKAERPVRNSMLMDSLLIKQLGDTNPLDAIQNSDTDES